MMEGLRTEAPACNTIELMDIIMSICQDPRQASSPAVRRQIEGLTMGSAEGSATPVGVVAEIEVLHQALERLQEKERRARLKLAEAKRVILALEEANRALSMEAQALAGRAGQAAALARDLQKAYAMQDEILVEHQKMQEEKKVEEAKRVALNSELARVKVEKESSNLAAETAQRELVATQEELERFQAVQQELVSATHNDQAILVASLLEELARTKVEMKASDLAAETARRKLVAAQEELARFQTAQEEGQASFAAALQEELARAKVETESFDLAAETARGELLVLLEEYAKIQSMLVEARAGCGGTRHGVAVLAGGGDGGGGGSDGMEGPVPSPGRGVSTGGREKPIPTADGTGRVRPLEGGPAVSQGGGGGCTAGLQPTTGGGG